MTVTDAVSRASSTAGVPVRADRWVPARAGLVSVWRYVEETFCFHQGRLLLRGPNAVPQVSLEESAGSEPLDREVLAAFRRAAEVVPVSMAGNAGEVSIRLPVHFDQAVLD